MNDTTIARQARCYLRARRHGVLSTLSRRISGYPYGSIVPFVLDHEARAVILVSRLAEHTKNMETNPKVSLVARDDGDDIQAGARATMLGDAERFECGNRLRTRFLRYQPQAGQLLGLGDFAFWRLTPVALRYIAGFGAIRWVSAADFTAPANVLEDVESDIVSHMNADHSDVLRACCRGSLGSDVGEAVMLGVDCDGFDAHADGTRLRFDFPETALDSESVRRALIDMARDARKK